jgi:hypothetical protein
MRTSRSISVRHPKPVLIGTLATDEDRVNPDYTDPCFEAQNEMCSYCCILSKGECSRDIRACDPVPVDTRHFSFFYILVATLVAVICGCPLIAQIYMGMVHTRFL